MKPDLSRMSINQLQQLTGFSYRTVSRRLKSTGVKAAARDGRAVFYDPQEALPALYGSKLADGVTDLASERARLAKAQTRTAELRNAELEGELLRRRDVLETWTTKITAAKSKLRGIPKRAQRQVPGLTRAMAKALLKLIDEVLHDLAGDGLPTRTQARPARHRR